MGVSRANFEKYLGTFLLFHLRRGWVGGKIGIFEKSAYVPSKKYLHPPPRSQVKFVVKFPVQIGTVFYSFVPMILLNIFSILTILFMLVRCYPFED